MTACKRTPDAEAAPDAGPRLAVLSPALSIILRDLASADRIVGRHGYDMVLDKAIPVVGDESGINYEALVGVNPSHIVLELGAKGLPPRLEEMAAAQHWTIVALPMRSLTDVEAAVPALAELVGTDAARSRTLALRAEMDRAWARTDRTRALLGRTVVLSSIDPIGVMGPGSFHHEMIGRMGAVPVPEEGAAFITLSHEDLVRLNPDTIVLLSPSAPARFGFETDAMGAIASLPVKAIEERDLIVVAHPLCQTPSTALIDVADEIVKRYAHMRWGPGQPAATP